MVSHPQKMFGEHSRIDNDWIIRNPEPMKYVMTPLLERGDVMFQNNTLPRSVGEIETTINPATELRDSKLTTMKGRHDLITDRIGLTTPHIRYGDPDDYTKVTPKESLPMLSALSGKDLPSCNRGHPDIEVNRMVNVISYPDSNHVQDGFSQKLGVIPMPVITRNID